jgi:hypothetical protein
VAIARLAPPEASDFAIATIGVLAAASIVFDGGGTNYLLTRQSQPTRPEYRFAVGVQGSIALPGYALALTWQALRAPTDLWALWWLAVVTFAVGQLLDTVLRVARAPRLWRGEDRSYAVPELVSGGARLVLAIACLASGSLLPSLLGPLVGAAVLVAVLVAEHGRSKGHGRPPRLLDVLSFGIGSALSALYSQMPMIVGTAVLTWSDAARLAIAYRFTQPLEMIPATISTQSLPRLVRRPQMLKALVAIMLALGAVVAVTLITAQGWLFSTLALPDGGHLVFVVVALALIPKFANYSLVSAIIAFGGVRTRIWMNVCLGLLVTGLAVGLATYFGVVGISFTTLIAEVLLLCVSVAVLRHFATSERLNGNEDPRRELRPVGGRGGADQPR